MNTFKITTDILPDIFENVIDTHNTNETDTVIRSNLKTFEDIDKWVHMFGHNTKTHWNLRSSVPNGVYKLCSAVYLKDVHSEIIKFGRNSIKTLQIRRLEVEQQGLCGVVIIRNIHSHAIGSAQSLRFLPADQTLKYKFWDYFEDGMGITKSRKHHQRIIKLMGGSEVEHDLASSRCNPTYRTVRHWYDQWRLKHLRPRTGVGVIEKLKEEETPAIDSADGIVNFDVKLEAQEYSCYEEVTVENPKIMYTNALSAENVTPVSDLL